MYSAKTIVSVSVSTIVILITKSCTPEILLQYFDSHLVFQRSTESINLIKQNKTVNSFSINFAVFELFQRLIYKIFIFGRKIEK